jgi:hypothetical protein
MYDGMGEEMLHESGECEGVSEKAEIASGWLFQACGRW